MKKGNLVRGNKILNAVGVKSIKISGKVLVAVIFLTALNAIV